MALSKLLTELDNLKIIESNYLDLNFDKNITTEMYLLSKTSEMSVMSVHQ